MGDLSDKEAAQTIKVVGADPSTGLEGNYLAVDIAGNLAIALNGTLSTLNSTSAPLGSGGVFTGTFEEILNASTISVILKADQASASLGFVIQWSNDGSTILDFDRFNLPANTGKQYSFGAMARYYRIVYTNGAIAQTSFQLQTVLHKVPIKNSSHRIEDNISGEDDAELVKSVVTGKDPSGVYQNLKVDENGNLIVTALTGFNADFRFGDVSTSATTQVAVRETAYTEQSSNAQRSVSSSSASDTSAGTGARTIKITYLTATGTGPFTETITLNGTTPVNTVATNICFIEKIEVLTVGSNGSNVGTISLFASTAGAGGTVGSIAVGDNKTFWSHHYVPVSKTANVTGMSVSNNATATNDGALFVLKSIAIPTANMAEQEISDEIRITGQTTTISRAYASPVKVTGPARITLYVTPESGTSHIQRGAFDYFEP